MISTDISTATGVLTGATQTIAIGFYFMANADLVVTRNRSGVITTLTLDSDYSVVGAGNESGGSITVTGQAAGDVITIVRTVPYTQLVDLVPLTRLSETLLERALDKDTMMAQQLRRDLDALNAATIEEAPTDGASYARKNADWEAIPGGGDMLSTNNLSDLTNAATARANIGLGTAATTAVEDYATSAQGVLAATAVQPADLGNSSGLDVGSTAGTVAAGNDARIVAGGTALQPTGSGSGLTDITATQVGAATTAQGALADTAVQASTSPHILFVDAGRADTYTPDGTDNRPYKTISTAIAAWAALNNGATIFAAPYTYVTGAGTFTLPDYSLVLHGNCGAITGGGTFNIPGTYVAKNLSTTANVNFTSGSGAHKVTLEGQTITGNVTVSAGVTLLLERTTINGNLSTESGSIVKVSFDSEITGTKTILGTIRYGIKSSADILTANRVVVTDSDGLPLSSSVTDSELNHVSGVTSGIQSQINDKAPLASPELTGTPTVPTAPVSTNTDQAASTAFVMAEQALDLKASNNLSDVNDANIARANIGIISSPVINMLSDSGRFALLSDPFDAMLSYDSYSASTISIVGSTSTLTSSVSGFSTSIFSSGSLVTIQHASNSENILMGTVLSSSTSTIVLTGVSGMVDEEEGSAIAIKKIKYTGSRFLSSNAATVSQCGALMYNTVSKGGTGYAENEISLEFHTSILGSNRYCIESNIIKIVFGSTSNTATTNNAACMFGPDGWVTWCFWLKCSNTTGHLTVPSALSYSLSINGGDNVYYNSSDSINIDNTLVNHYKISYKTVAGNPYISNFPYLGADSGTIMYMCMPVILNGTVNCGVHITPIINY